PKAPKPPADPNRNRVLLGAGLAAAVLVLVCSLCYTRLAKKEDEIDRLTLHKADLDKKLLHLEDDAKRIKAIDDWVQTEVCWLDELYDLTDRFPDTNLIRLTQLVCD